MQDQGGSRGGGQRGSRVKGQGEELGGEAWPWLQEHYWLAREELGLERMREVEPNFRGSKAEDELGIEGCWWTSGEQGSHGLGWA